jgi:hypothetical protein
MAGAKEVIPWGNSSRQDTRQDTPLEALPEADSRDPGGQRGDDTRRDPVSEAESVHLCGRWVWIKQDTRQDRQGERVSLKWND